MSITTRKACNQSELQSTLRIRTSCPYFEASAYGEGEADTSRQIDVATFLRRLRALDLGPHSPIHMNAQRLGAKCKVDPRELLHMAIVRASKPNASRPDIDLVPYLTMVMRSIASGINPARTRASERGVDTPLPYVAEQMPTVRSIRDPYREILRAQERDRFALLIEELHNDDPLLQRLIDCIGKGERGRTITKELGLGCVELASLRRNLKRRAQRIAKREALLAN